MYTSIYAVVEWGQIFASKNLYKNPNPKPYNNIVAAVEHRQTLTLTLTLTNPKTTPNPNLTPTLTSNIILLQ